MTANRVAVYARVSTNHGQDPEGPRLVSSALRIKRALRYPAQSPILFVVALNDLLKKV
jgi:hypothetical protein